MDGNVGRLVYSLTEAAKLVPTAIILASLPESDPKKDQKSVQIGGEQGLRALRELESVVGRVQALWKPVATEEAFEIVRRRLAFEADPDAFAARWADEEERLAARIAAARAHLDSVRLPERELLRPAGGNA